MGKDIKGLIILAAIAVPAVLIAIALTSGKSEAPTANSSEQTNTTQKTTSNTDESDTSANATDTKDSSVEIKNHAYSPATITVKVGTTVTWTNQDGVRHDVVATNASADAPSSELLARGESYSFTFNKPGTYDYYCTPHPYMKGKVIVTE